jgi:hypothetical protein
MTDCIQSPVVAWARVWPAKSMMSMTTKAKS